MISLKNLMSNHAYRHRQCPRPKKNPIEFCPMNVNTLFSKTSLQNSINSMWKNAYSLQNINPIDTFLGANNHYLLF